MYSVNDLLRMAAEMKASDLHLTVGVPPKVRVFGELRDIDAPKLMPPDIHTLAYSILPQTQIPKFEEKGELDFSYSIPGFGRYRANVYHQRGSLAVVIRLVGETIPTPDKLGIPDSVLELIHKRRGLVLVTGPTGSGKSTTLASIIDMINNNREAHVITLEDPIEFTYQHRLSIVNQREIGTDSDSYANALRAALREDPDVILVGEMRDLETISTAITAAETGHLVLSTVHTIGSTNTVDRLIDVFPSHQQQQIRIQLASVLEAIISQQLLPAADDSSRLAAFEVLHVNSAVRNLIREGKNHQLITYMQTYRKQGMITMDEAIIELYRQQKITREAALQFAQDPETMQNKMLR